MELTRDRWLAAKGGRITAFGQAQALP